MRVRLLCLCEGVCDRGPPATIRVAIRAGNPEPSNDWIATLSKTKARDDNAQFGLRFSIRICPEKVYRSTTPRSLRTIVREFSTPGPVTAIVPELLGRPLFLANRISPIPVIETFGLTRNCRSKRTSRDR